MASYTVEEAKQRLTELVERAVAQEETVAIQAGEDEVVLAPRPRTKGILLDLKELKAIRDRLGPSIDVDTTALNRQMRDEVS